MIKETKQINQCTSFPFKASADEMGGNISSTNKDQIELNTQKNS